jgi:transposase InsO family protein
MTHQEWLRLGAHMNKMWPHHPIPPATVAEWYPYLAELEAAQVRAAIDAFVLDGSSFPPTVGQIRGKVVELGDQPQLWGEAWREIQARIAQFGVYSEPDTIPWSTDDVREVVRLKGWEYLCTTIDPVSVVEAQCRELWESIRTRRRQDATYACLPGAGLSRLERISRRPHLTPLRHLLPSGEEEEEDGPSSWAAAGGRG